MASTTNLTGKELEKTQLSPEDLDVLNAERSPRVRCGGTYTVQCQSSYASSREFAIDAQPLPTVKAK
jgi:hypothetical protein